MQRVERAEREMIETDRRNWRIKYSNLKTEKNVVTRNVVTLMV